MYTRAHTHTHADRRGPFMQAVRGEVSRSRTTGLFCKVELRLKAVHYITFVAAIVLRHVLYCRGDYRLTSITNK